MHIKLKITPKVAYLFSIFVALIFLVYFAYSGTIAYIIHRELYGGGIDILVTLRAILAGIIFFLIILFIQFLKIKDLKSQRTILKGLFVVWSTIFVVLITVNLNLIYFILLTGMASLVTLVTVYSLVDQIKEEKNTLSDKEIYLLQKLANKK